MAEAWRIVDWLEHYEVNSSGRPLQPGQDPRAAPLGFVRWKAMGLMISPQYDDLCQAAGPLLAAAALGLFGKLIEVAASTTAERRGCVLDRKQKAMGPGEMASRFRFDLEAVVLPALAALETAGWIEVAEIPWADCGQPVRLCAYIKVESEDGGQSAGAAVNRGASERNRTELNVTKNNESAAAAAELGCPDPSPASSDSGDRVSDSERIRADSGSEVRDSGSDSGDLGAGRGIRGGQSPQTHASGDAMVEGETGEASERAPPEGCREKFEMLWAWEEMVRWFPGLRSESKQGRADVTTVHDILSWAGEQDDGKTVRRVLMMAEKLAASRILRNPLAAWIAAVQKELGWVPESKR